MISEPNIIEDARYLNLLRYFDVSNWDIEKDLKLKERLQTIWDWAIKNTINNNIDEAMQMITRLDNELGVPPVRISKDQQMYQHIKLSEVSKNLHEQIREIEAKKNQLTQLKKK